MADSVKKDFGPEDLVDMADRDGCAIAQVRDGYVLIFTKKQLQDLLTQCDAKKSERCMIFVQHRDFKN